jgi:hypothetical protein
MKHRLVLSAVAVAITAASAWAQPYYARGDFNGFGLDDQLTEINPTHFRGMVGGLTPGDMRDYKLANEDWSFSVPGSNGRVAVDGAGEITFNLFLGAFGDGWSPAENRVGYEDSGMHGWDIMGSFNGWSAPVIVLNDMGNGLYSGQYVVPAPGNYEFKFRKDGDWAIPIGDDFGSAATNIPVETTAANEVVAFELDLPNGRWRVVPEPATLTMLAMGGLAMIRRRRHR